MGFKLVARTQSSHFPSASFMAKGARTLDERETLSGVHYFRALVANGHRLGHDAIGTTPRCSDNHCELRTPAAADMDEEEYSKHKKKLHGHLKTYTWNPNRNGGNDTADVRVVPQVVGEWLFDVNETLALWVRMRSFTPSPS